MSTDPQRIDDDLLRLRAACLEAICQKLRYQRQPVLIRSLLKSGATNKVILQQLTAQQSVWIRARVLTIYLWRRRKPILLIFTLLLISGALSRLFLGL